MPQSFNPARLARRPLVLRVIMLLLLALAFILCTSVMDGGAGIVPAALWHTPKWASIWSAPWRMFCNALPGLLLALVLLALTRRAWLSFVLAFLLQALLYGINALKVKNLGAPLAPEDFRMVGQVGNGGGELLSGYLPHSPWPYLAIVALVALLVALVRYEPPVMRRHAVRSRLLLGSVTLLALGTLLAAMPFWQVVYSRKVLGMQAWSAKATTRHTGLISALMLYRLQYGARKEKPNVHAALKFMASLDPAMRRREQATPPGTEQQPDIVVILSESFFDPTTLNGYDKNVDFMPNLHRLAQHGTSGWMHSPTFGGGTIRTEFEVLTGLPLRYFKNIMFPYLQLDQKVIPGIVRLLKRHGYQTLAVHGGDPHFWNRVSALKALGFDRFISEGDFPANDAVHDGKYMSDKSFTDELLRQLKPDGPPRFVLGISIEAHGPYDQDYGIDTRERDAIPVPATITGDARTQLQNYIYHIRHADQQLGRLADTLAKRNRPTLIVFFGDHLPAIVPAFQAAGFKDGRGFLVQRVPYLLIDTAQLHTAPAVKKNTAAWALPGMLLAHTRIHDDPWFALTDVVAPKLENLTRAPDAPRPRETAEQEQLDKGMINVAELRLKGKLDALWPKAAAMAAQQQPTSNTTAAHTSPQKAAQAGH